MFIYLDNAATTKPTREVIDSMSKAMEEFYANPSSSHKLGMLSQKKINNCRQEIANTIHASGDEIFFTSSASEANNLILKGLLKEGTQLITTSFEHSSLRNTATFLEASKSIVTYLSVDSNGLINIDELKASINKNTVLVSIIYVNNEVGSIQNIKEIGELIKKLSPRAKFHVDAVQGYGKLPIDVKEMKIDALTVSAHKIHGPKGVGFCYIAKGVNPTPLIHGGSQEKGLRAGTENLPGIVGLTTASINIFSKKDENYLKVKEIKEYMIKRLGEIDNIRINSPLNNSFSPYILNISFIGVRGEVLMNFLENEDVFVSTGSACTSKSKSGFSGSYVLKAMNLSQKEIEGALRFSFSPDNTKEEIDATIEVLKKGLKLLRRKK